MDHEPQTFLYDAFISYRHTEPDITIAKKLMDSLEGYKAPGYIAKKSGIKIIKRIFRDREELPTTTDLSESILNALKSSKFLIVICSPRTPESKWVNKEIEIFKELRGAQYIQALLIEGEPEESFPEPLHYETKHIINPDGSYTEQFKELELLAADIRTDELKGKNRLAYGTSISQDKELLKKSIKLLKTERLRCLAPMFNCRFDELYQRHLRRSMLTIVTVSAVVIAMLSAFGIYVMRVNNQLTKQSNIALKSQSLFLADLSGLELAKGDRVTATMLALEALPKDFAYPERPYVAEAETALWNASHNSLQNYLPKTILKHNSNVNYVVFSPDNSKIITVSEDKIATMWDTASGKQIAQRQDHNTNVIYAEFSPDSSKVVTSTHDASIIWDAETGRRLATLKAPENGNTKAKFSPDGSMLLDYTTFGPNAAIWDTKTGRKRFVLKGMNVVSSAEFSSDGSKIVTTHLSNNSIIWDAKTGKKIIELNGDPNGIETAEFNLDGSKVIAGTCKNDAVIYNAVTGKLLHRLKGHGDLGSANFSPDGSKIITTANDNVIVVWNAATGKVIKQLDNNRNKLHYAHFSPDGKKIAATFSNDMTLFTILWDAASYQEVQRLQSHISHINTEKTPLESQFSPDCSKIAAAYDDKSVIVWDSTVGKEFVKLSGHYGEVYDIQFNKNGNTILTIGSDGKAIIWDALKGRMIKSVFGGYKDWNATFSPNGRNVVVGFDDNTSIIWDITTMKKVARLTGYTSEFNNKGSKLATISGEKTIIIWEAKTGRETARIKSEFKIHQAAFTPDDSKIITFPNRGQNEGQIAVWDATTGKHTAQLYYSQNVNSAEINPDSSQIAVVYSDGKLIIWDTRTGKKLIQYGGVGNYISNCLFSPDGKRYATISVEGPPIIWDAKTGDKVLKLDGHRDEINSIANSADGRYIVTSSDDGTAIIWNADTGKQVRILRGHTPIIESAAFSPNGKMVMTRSNDGTTSIWNIAKGIELERLDGQNATFGPDSRSVVTSLPDGSVIIWPINNLKDLLLEAKNLVKDRKFTPQENKEYFLQ